ncbi:MAG: uroporphyrinogen-III synthase [Parvularcula sp.]|jgi:uroporphyrinogen-III synthase|nr:uroporphyrinogen-III synthase [Parvularcula sp.]
MSLRASEAQILVTRPEPEATAFGRVLAEAGWKPVIAPLTAIVDRAPGDLPSGVSHVLLTSPRAAKKVPPDFRRLPVIAVGPRTAAAAARADLNVEQVAEEAADSRLVALIPEGSFILHLTGEHISRELGPAVQAKGARYHRAVVYEARAAEALPEAAMHFLDAPEAAAATFLSQRAAVLFAELLPAGADLSRIDAFALSSRIAETLRASLSFREVLTPPREGYAAFVDFIRSRRP